MLFISKHIQSAIFMVVMWITQCTLHLYKYKLKVYENTSLGIWVDPRAYLDMVAKRKVPAPNGNCTPAYNLYVLNVNKQMLNISVYGYNVDRVVQCFCFCCVSK